MMSSIILPYTFIAIRLPSDSHKVFKTIPDTTISLGKYGSFPINALLGRPFYVTFEILDKASDQDFPELRIVPPSELHADGLADPESVLHDFQDDSVTEAGSDAHLGDYLEKSNRLTIDNASRQTLSMQEIEQLKTADTTSGKDIVARIMQAHSALDEKTAFSLAKYSLRKAKKYMRRFVALPLDVSMLAHWLLHEKEAAKILEVREEMLGLVASWANVHFAETDHDQSLTREASHDSSGRWLIIDDTGGLIVAAMAERMGILYPENPIDNSRGNKIVADGMNEVDIDALPKSLQDPDASRLVDGMLLVPAASITASSPTKLRHKVNGLHPDAISTTTNTLTLIHSATQPNLSLLAYFLYDPNDNSIASTTHPLHAHLKTLSWLQLLHPSLSNSYVEPEHITDDVLASLNSGKKTTYYRKRRRWNRISSVIDEARAGAFDGLVVATAMDLTTIMHYTVPLLRGGAQVVVYGPNVEQLAELVDCYSTGHKTAFITQLQGSEITGGGSDVPVPSEDFPVDPRLLLGASLQTVRARDWQTLPGRTHPIMTSKGGAEGYLFTATRVLPAEGRVEARGTFAKKRKGPVKGTVMNGGTIFEHAEKTLG